VKAFFHGLSGLMAALRDIAMLDHAPSIDGLRRRAIGDNG
jgi:hypothetical protein